MLGKIKSILLGDAEYSANAESQQDREQLALASLLVEMARADFDETQDEHGLIIDLLVRHYELTSAEALELLNKARLTNDKAVCLFDFTRALHDSLDEQQKHDVIRLLWQVAMSDNKLDKYEDYLVRKVADLLYVSHADVVRIKHEVVDVSG